MSFVPHRMWAHPLSELRAPGFRPNSGGSSPAFEPGAGRCKKRILFSFGKAECDRGVPTGSGKMSPGQSFPGRALLLLRRPDPFR